ncbi:MAG: hypothetical protein JWR09_3129, partial [Mucilaginibacter sp.]|nr:hypothetical protein [Mucilaginibacter sp.]
YDRREILVPDFIPLYASYRQGIVDANNISVQRYELNRYNFDLFIKQVFPEIYEQKNSLKDFFKEFKWE